jgi:hypothetical protein
MAQFRYHVSQEQFTLSNLIDYVSLAEQAGFTVVMSCDHLCLRAKDRGKMALHGWEQPFKLQTFLITVPTLGL